MGFLPDREHCDCDEPSHSADECYHIQYSGGQSQPVAICKNTGGTQISFLKNYVDKTILLTT